MRLHWSIEQRSIVLMNEVIGHTSVPRIDRQLPVLRLIIHLLLYLIRIDLSSNRLVKSTYLEIGQRCHQVIQFFCRRRCTWCQRWCIVLRLDDLPFNILIRIILLDRRHTFGFRLFDCNRDMFATGWFATRRRYVSVGVNEIKMISKRFDGVIAIMLCLPIGNCIYWTCTLCTAQFI